MKQAAVYDDITSKQPEMSPENSTCYNNKGTKGYECTFISVTSFRNRLHTVGILPLCCRPGTSFLEKCLDQPMEDNDPDTHIYSNTTNFLASSCIADFLHGCNFVPTFTIKKGYMQQASTGKENR